MKLLVTSILLAILCIQENKAQDTLNYFDHYYEGLSKSDEKPICLILTGITCENNKKLNKELMEKDLVKFLNEEFHTIKLNMSDIKRTSPKDKARFQYARKFRYYSLWWAAVISEKYNVRKYPSAFLIDTNENAMSSIYHYGENRAFFEWLKNEYLMLDFQPNK